MLPSFDHVIVCDRSLLSPVVASAVPIMEPSSYPLRLSRQQKVRKLLLVLCSVVLGMTTIGALPASATIKRTYSFWETTSYWSD